ncbi:hypothetical protein IMCC3317_28660 [Kordia antarctica]|uniref:Uncharacterized protein n=1 Tax=Kordia antarctica TaxID=1218801 RepID=A0A7L4ZLW1_9FLAO|nr:hypothetical protein [Kordia antarctica]QHI37487.1 hypothetical protein IMCC3317_28660 [Kordia antarctica]
MNFSKFSPRIRKFLTKNPCYTAEKTKKHSEILDRTQVRNKNLTPLEIIKKEVKQLIQTEQKDTFLNHMLGMFKRDFNVIGECSSEEIKLWQRNSWTVSLYAIFIFKFNAQQHLIDIKAELNFFGKVLSYGIFFLLLFIFIPKDVASYQHDNFWLFSMIKIISLIIYVLFCTVIYESEKRIQRQAIYELLDIEINEENTLKERSLFSIFIRIFTYPLGLATLYGSVFHFFPEGQYKLAIVGMVIVSAYFITDIILLFRKKK